MIAYKEHMVSTERLNAVRQKHADYDDLKAKANASDEAKSELEQLRERAESTEKKANELEHANQLRAWAEQFLGKYPTNQTSSTPSPLLMLNLKTIPTCTRIDTA